MRIALFHHLPSGGALRLVAHSARLLAARGHEVGLFTFSSAEQAFAPWPLDGMRVVEPLDFRGVGRYRAYDRATASLARQIDVWRPDVVWVEKCRIFGHPPILTQLRSRTILHTHEPRRVRAIESLAPVSSPTDVTAIARTDSRGSAWATIQRMARLPGYLREGKGDREAIAAAGQVLTSSHFTVEWLRRAYGVSAQVLAPGIDTAIFTPNASVPRLPRVLSIGRLSPAKGHDFVVEVLAAIPAAERPALDIACDEAPAEERAKLEQLAARLQVSVTLHHRVTEPELVLLYQSARAVLCAAHREPFGLAPPEAMACGTPVIAVREGGFAETVADRITGYLLSRDVDTWARTLREFLADAALAARLGANGVERVRTNWSAEGWVARAAEVTGLAL